MRLPDKVDLMPWMARIISNPTTRRYSQAAFRWQSWGRGESDVVEVFINLRDPFSFVLLQALPDLTQRFRIQLRFQTVWHQPADMFPEPGMWTQWAVGDAARLASLYGLESPDPHSQPSEEEMAACRDYLLGLEHTGDYLPEATTALQALWQTRTVIALSGADSQPPELEERLRTNEQRLRTLGHYQGSMLCFRGEWFWGVDRLDHLERLLIDEGMHQQPEKHPVWDRTCTNLGKQATTLPDKHLALDDPLEVFFPSEAPTHTSAWNGQSSWQRLGTSHYDCARFCPC